MSIQLSTSLGGIHMYGAQSESTADGRLCMHNTTTAYRSSPLQLSHLNASRVTHSSLAHHDLETFLLVDIVFVWQQYLVLRLDDTRHSQDNSHGCCLSSYTRTLS